MTAVPVRPVVLAGGGGTRLWPLSRGSYPKQFLKLGADSTLLQQTLARAAAVATLNPVVLCNEEHRYFVLHQARDVGVEPETVVLEPAGRNTAPALTVAALLEQSGEYILAMLPADHRIADPDAFAQAMRAAAEIAAGGAIVALGVPPDRPETGYGYIRAGAQLEGSSGFRIERFAEKPDASTAAQYLRDGGYLWNCGIFVVQAQVWLRAIRACAPEILEACTRAVQQGVRDGVFLRLDRAPFEGCPSDSVDYAVMERLGELDIPGAVVPFDGGWSDVGSWSSLWAIEEADATGNLLHGDALAVDSKNSAIHSEHRLVAALGVEDLIIVETVDAVLVAQRGHAQEVKDIVARLGDSGRDEAMSHRRVYRPWGSYETVDRGERFQVKRIRVLPGHSLSLQMHHQRAEHWVVVRGTARVVRGEETLTLHENESTYIPAGMKHRLANDGSEPLEIIEVQSGAYLGEDDIVRFEDAYDRK